MLSPKTADYDKGEKFAYYRTVPSIQEVLFADPERRSIQLARRTETSWTRDEPVEDGSVEVGALGVMLSLGDLFKGRG